MLLVPRAARATLPATVIACQRDPSLSGGIIQAETEFLIPSGFSLCEPRFDVVVETPRGWRRLEAGTIGDRNLPLNLRPGGKNRMTFILPPNTLRWRLHLGGREAGLRERFFNWLSSRTGSWAREDSDSLRPAWTWLCRRLPNVPGRTLQLESKVLQVRSQEPLNSPHNRLPPANSPWAFRSRQLREARCILPAVAEGERSAAYRDEASRHCSGARLAMRRLCELCGLAGSHFRVVQSHHKSSLGSRCRWPSARGYTRAFDAKSC